MKSWPPIVRSGAKRGVIIALLGPVWGILLAFLGGSSMVNPISGIGLIILVLTLHVPHWVSDQLRITPILDAILRVVVYVVWNVALGGGVGALCGLLIARWKQASRDANP